MGNINTVYLAGKITGEANYHQKFERAAARLQSEGYTVLSPTILPPLGFGYSAYIRMSAAMLDECTSVCFLPDWIDSDGAKEEYNRAKMSGKHIFFYADWLQEQDKSMTKQKYILSSKETGTLLFWCWKCEKVSVYPAKKADGRVCVHCGERITPIGYAEKAGEVNAAE